MERPTIVCLCGSTRFMQAFQEADLRETLAGKIVLTVGCDTKSDVMLGFSPDVKMMLDELHKRKIDLADEILVLNVGGYVGRSTRSEIDYARMHGKRVRWLESVLCSLCSDWDVQYPVGCDFFGGLCRIGSVLCCDVCYNVYLLTYEGIVE